MVSTGKVEAEILPEIDPVGSTLLYIRQAGIASSGRQTVFVSHHLHFEHAGQAS